MSNETSEARLPSQKDTAKAQMRAILEEAMDGDFCDLVVIGVLPNGKGLWQRWSGSTVASLVLMLEAAKADAVGLYLHGINHPDGRVK